MGCGASTDAGAALRTRKQAPEPPRGSKRRTQSQATITFTPSGQVSIYSHTSTHNTLRIRLVFHNTQLSRLLGYAGYAHIAVQMAMGVSTTTPREERKIEHHEDGSSLKGIGPSRACVRVCV